MPEKLKQVRPPRGIARWLYRLPIKIYSIGLGRIFGYRFLLLTHTGRKSGLARNVVLEVVSHDKAEQTFVVAAGFGPTSDWYLNILADPLVIIESGNMKQKMKATVISEDAAGWEMLAYARKHPMAARELSKLMGYKVDGSEEDYRAFGKTLKMVRFSKSGE